MSIKITFFCLAVVLSNCFFAASEASAQSESKTRYYLLSVFNSGTQLPGGSLFSLPIHPGVTAGAEFRYNRRIKNQWFQTAKLGFSHHRYVQTSIQLYSEVGYRRAIWRGTAAELRLGGGYLHAFSATDVFIHKEKNYEKKSNLGRPQVMTGGAIGVSYTLPERVKSLRFSVDYQFYLQLPFVKQYVPLLPNTLLHVGVAAPFSIFKK